MTPMQQILLGVGAKKKTYMDDVFSTFLYTGTSSAQTFNNGIDVSGKGGLVWIKSRSAAYSNALFDTVRGKTKRIKTNSSDAQDTDTSYLADFKTNGFEVGTSASTNNSGHTFTSWTFRKAPGFFTVKEYSGSGSAQDVTHDLGSVPGLIIIKCTSHASQDWVVGHRSLDYANNDYLKFNTNDQVSQASSIFGGTAPTSTSFRVSHSGKTNESGKTYIAYIFAGGESTAATARSVDFDGNDYLTIADSADWDLGQTFTIEAWVKLDALNNYNVIISQDSNSPGWYMSVNSNGQCEFYDFNGGEQVMSSVNSVGKGMWTHIAFVANSGTGQWYINGTKSGSSSSMNVQGGSSDVVYVGAQLGPNWYVDGKISNLRVVKGTAVYTSSFRPPTEPLTNITNTKLLCCNNSSTTGSTVTPGTITATGSPIASTDSPFDDPAGFKFGESQEGVIKTGSYVGNGSTDGPEINLGWEPQWVLFKLTNTTSSWWMFDSMRGITHGGNDPYLTANDVSGETDGYDALDITSTGFKLKHAGTWVNASGNHYTYTAIRRPDGYVGKPVENATKVFGLGMSNFSSTTPCQITNFVTDFGLIKTISSTSHWYTGARLFDKKFVLTDVTNAQSNSADMTFDANNGFAKGNSTSWQHWAWKRHAGADVVTWVGNGVAGRPIRHSMNKTPEMMWVKVRSDVGDWQVYHKGLNGGSSPEDYFLRLNTTEVEADEDATWNDTAPTSTHFTLGNGNGVNASNQNYIAMLFASVDGFSKVGSYTGNASNSGPTINLGFNPRFIMLKNANDGGGDWNVYDTERGLSSQGESRLYLNSSTAADTGNDITPSSTGFQIVNSWGNINGNGNTIIYYAHA